MKPGIKVMDPITAAMAIPTIPDSLPSSFDMVSSSKTARIKPISSKIAKNWGRIFSKDFQAFLRARIVFSLLFTNETPNSAAVQAYNTNAVIPMLRQIESICLYAEDTPQCSFRIQTAKTLNVRRTLRGVHAGCRQNQSRPACLAHKQARLRMHLLKPLRPPRFSFH